MAPSVVISGFGEVILANGATLAFLEDNDEGNLDLGMPVVETAVVTRILGDGDVETGTRSGNTPMTLALIVPSNLGSTLPLLAEAVDRASWTLTYTPDTTGLPVVKDCFRATLHRKWVPRDDQVGYTQVALTFNAAPFWRNPTPVTVTPSFSGRVQVDSFDSVTGWTVSALGGAGPVSIAVDTATFVEGTGSGKITLANSQGFTASKTITAADYSGMSTFAVQGLTDFTQVPGFGWSFKLTLSSSGGRSSTWDTLSASPPDPTQWRSFGWDLTRTPTVTSGGVDRTAVTGVTLVFNGYLVNSTQHFWLDDLSAFPAGGGFAASSNMQLRFDGIQGSARTPVSVEVDSGSAFAGILMSNNPGAPVGSTPILPVAASTTVPAVRYQKDGSTPSTYEVVIRQITAANTAAATNLSAAMVSTQSASRQFNTTDWDRGAWMLAGIGQLALPPDYVDPQNTASLVTFTEGVPWDAVWLLDVTAETVQATLPTTTKTVYLDAPGPMDFYGKMTATATDRTAAVSVMSGRVGQAWINFTPNVANYLLVAIFNNAAAGGPTLTGVKITYFPRWHFPERPY